MKARITASRIYAVVFLAFSLPVHAQYAEIQAARVNEIAALLPDAPQALAPPCQNRVAWEPFANVLAPEIEKANTLLGKSFPAWSDDDYLDYFKTGSRDRGQSMLSARQSWLTPLLLAECAEWKGRFIPVLAEVLDELATQKSWALPAHDVDQGYFTGKRYFVELNSAEVGYMLATSLALLGDHLPVATRSKVMNSLETRMFQPVRASYTSGKGQTWLHVTSNWNAVCLAGVTGAALAVLPEKHDRAFFVAAAEYYQQFYKKSFTEDGFEVEGIGYWNYGFSNYAILREELWQATHGKIDLFNDPKIRNVAKFGRDIQMLPGVIAYFSDAHFGTQPDPKLMTYIQYVFDRQSLLSVSDRGKLSSVPLALQLILYFPSQSQLAEAVSSQTDSSLRTYYSVAGVLIARPNNEQGLAFTIKASGDGPHNHNDIGSYAIGLGDAEPTGEPGGPAYYTAQTFSRDRFSSKLLNSYGHPVPVVDGQLQRNSLNVQAAVSSISFTPQEDKLSIDLTDAYNAPVLTRLLRSIAYSRQGRGSVEIVDTYDVKDTVPVEEAIITRGTWKEIDDATLEFTANGETVRLKISAPSNFVITSENIHEYGSPFTRIAIQTKIHSGDAIKMHFEPKANQKE